MYCVVCGSKVGEDEKFCSNCGEPAGKKAPAQQPAARHMYQQNMPAQGQPMPQQQFAPPPAWQPAGQPVPGWNGQPVYQPYPQQKSSNTGVVAALIVAAVLIVVGTLMSVLAPVMLGYTKSSQLASANARARIAYNVVSEYTAEMESVGMSSDIESYSVAYYGDIDCKACRNDGGLAGRLSRAMYDSGKDPGYVCIIIIPDGYVVQWRKDKDSRIIGQYPQQTDYADIENGNVYWGECYQEDRLTNYN